MGVWRIGPNWEAKTPQKKSNKSLLLAGVFTVLGLGILLKLGFWQVERLAWKEEILTRIETNMSGPPMALSTNLSDPNLEYSRVCAEGEFLHDKELYVFASNQRGEGGVHIYTPLKLQGTDHILVNRGWVPNPLKEPETRLEGQAPGKQTVCGVLRLDRVKSSFTPDNNVQENRWFTPEVSTMAKSAGVAVGSIFFLEADITENPGGYPIGGQTFVNIPNNHLGYAITWFGLALTLIGVFSVFVYSQKRKD